MRDDPGIWETEEKSRDSEIHDQWVPVGRAEGWRLGHVAVRDGFQEPSAVFDKLGQLLPQHAYLLDVTCITSHDWLCHIRQGAAGARQPDRIASHFDPASRS